MYKLLFAEDEPLTRNGILNGIDWEGLGISEIRAAKNGLLAYDIAREFHPDILLTDIRMPKMDGIELSHKVRDLNPHCSILMISGYSEMEYLRSALSLSAVDFVDKPIKLDHLTRLVQKAIEGQRSYSQRQSYLNKKAAILPASSSWNAEEYLYCLQELLPSVDASLDGISIVLKFIADSDSHLGALTDYNTLREQFLPILRKLSVPFLLDSTDDGNTYLHLYLQPNTAFHMHDFAHQLYQHWSKIFSHHDLYLYIGSREKVAMQNISCAHAIQTSEYLFFYKENHILYYQDVCMLRPAPLSYLHKDLHLFDLLLSSSNRTGSLAFLQHLKERIPEDYIGCEISELLKLYSLILIKILSLQSTIPHDEGYLLWELSDCLFLEDVHLCVADYLANALPESDNTPQPNNIDTILALIHNQYSNKDLSLNWISRQVYLSPSYICVKFKEQTNMTISQYVNDYRITVSKTLLADPELKINEIAEKAGFENGNYYAKLFRKATGVSPAEYRKQLNFNEDYAVN